MLFISFILFSLLLLLIVFVYNKVTCGINTCSRHLVGKVVIVTGANRGIGYDTAKDLAERGARLILACRDKGRGLAARNSIISSTGNQDVHFQQLDLESLDSVRSFADAILKKEKKLDVLINNAGVLISEYKKTDDGLLQQMQINHFGPFLLTNLLLPLLKASAPSRIINVSSEAYKRGIIDFENLNMEKETPSTYSFWQTYCNSKLCNILMALELSRQLEGTGVTINSLHPGTVVTEIFKLDNSWINHFIYFFINIVPLAKIFMKSSWEGAQTTIYLAVSPSVDGMSGFYYSDCKIQNTIKMAQNTETARKLWEISTNLVKMKKSEIQSFYTKVKLN